MHSQTLTASEGIDNCFFCSVPPSRVLFSTRSFQVVLPQGPLVEGHVILAPREHVSGLIDLPTDLRSELNAILISIKLACVNVLLAEHGHQRGDRPEAFHRHAHMQIIPSGVTLEKLLLNRGYDSLYGSFKDEISIVNGYLYYETTSEQSRFYVLNPPPEKYFVRRLFLVASELPLELADWKLYPRADIMEKTRGHWAKFRIGG